MSLIALVPIIVVLLILGTDAWVYHDARTHYAQGDPVICSIGSIQFDSPEVWAVACLLLFVLVFPVYLATRRDPT